MLPSISSWALRRILDSHVIGNTYYPTILPGKVDFDWMVFTGRRFVEIVSMASISSRTFLFQTFLLNNWAPVPHSLKSNPLTTTTNWRVRSWGWGMGFTLRSFALEDDSQFSIHDTSTGPLPYSSVKSLRTTGDKI